MIYTFIILYSLLTFLSPTINVGVPLRLEDFLLVLYLAFNAKRVLYFDKEMSKVCMILLAFAILNVVSIYISVFDGQMVSLNDFNTFFMYLKVVLIFIVGYNVSKDVIRLDKALLCLGVGALFSSIFSLIQYYNIGGVGEALYLIYGREERIAYGVTRSIGSVGNPNYSAYFSLILVSILLCFNDSKISKYIVIIPILATIITFSRTGLVALGILLLLYFSLKKMFKVLLGVIGAVVIIVPIYFYKIFSNTRLNVILSEGKQFDTTMGGRSDLIWESKLMSFFDNPLFGIGTRKSNVSDTVFDITVFDNSYIYILVTTGLIGFICYSVYYVKVFKKPLTNVLAKKQDTIDVFSTLILITTLIFFITTDLVKNIYYISFNSFLFGILTQNYYKK